MLLKMIARNYLTKVQYSQLDFPALNGLANQATLTETIPPVVVNGKVVLKIKKVLAIADLHDNKEHQVLKAQSVYEIPAGEIKGKEDLYAFYQDAEFNLFEGYREAQKHIPIPAVTVPPDEPIENYLQTLDYIYQTIQRLIKGVVFSSLCK
jgi:hypothetical protein